MKTLAKDQRSRGQQVLICCIEALPTTAITLDMAQLLKPSHHTSSKGQEEPSCAGTVSILIINLEENKESHQHHNQYKVSHAKIIN